MAEPYTDADLAREREFAAKGSTTHERRMLATVDALKRDFHCVVDHAEHWQARAEAAEAERDRLREALRYIAGWDVAGYAPHLRPEEVARAALEKD